MSVKRVGEKVGVSKVTSDNKKRLQAYLPPDDKKKLNRLSRACNTTESELASKILSYALNHPDYVRWLQTQFNVKDDDPFRIVPVVENGKVIY